MSNANMTGDQIFKSIGLNIDLNDAEHIQNLSISQLCNIIDIADNRYYRPGVDALIADSQYDALKLRLREMDPSNTRLSRVGAPYRIAELRDKVKHHIPMGSLDNTDDGINGYDDWYNRMSQGGDITILASEKMDGASICATYRQGQLIRVATRGNGEYGEDITINGANFRDLPSVLPESIDIDVRGEAILLKSDFDFICERDGISLEERSNPRNVGNGILARDDGKDSERIQFYAFNIVGEDIATEKAKMQRLTTLGFIPVRYRLCNNKEELLEYYSKVLENRDKLPFEIDGLVVALNEVARQNEFITTDIKSRLRPKYARAIKFPHKSNTTKLLDVILTVGHTKAIIPTAVLEEVRVGGVNVSHALLNNWDEINRLDIAIGDEVEVVLSGDIIPKIVAKVAAGINRKTIQEPTLCPACGHDTTRVSRGKEGAVTYCASSNCKAASLAKINHWIGTSKKGVGILGIGDAILKALWDSKLVSDPSDLYKLSVKDLENLELKGEDERSIKVGTSRAKQIITNINAKKQLTLPVFLGSLGIDLLGRRRVKLLSEAAGGKLSKLDSWLDTELFHSLDIPGLGDTIKESIVEGIEASRELIHKLLSVGVIVLDENDTLAGNDITLTDAGVKEMSNQPFAGYSFCLTGTRAYQDDIVRLGGELKSGVSKGLTFLVQADPLSTSGKTKKAEDYGIPIISIDYLKQAIDGTVTLDPANMPQNDGQHG